MIFIGTVSASKVPLALSVSLADNPVSSAGRNNFGEYVDADDGNGDQPVFTEHMRRMCSFMRTHLQSAAHVFLHANASSTCLHVKIINLSSLDANTGSHEDVFASHQARAELRLPHTDVFAQRRITSANEGRISSLSF